MASLIRIRGRTILGPILSEEERAQARVLRDRAVQTQLNHHRRRLHHHHHHTSSSRSQHRTQNEFSTTAATTTTTTNHKPAHSPQPSALHPTISMGRKTGDRAARFSSSRLSTFEGLEELPASPGSPNTPVTAASVSIQTDESSISLTTTASTDLHNYLQRVDEDFSSSSSVIAGAATTTTAAAGTASSSAWQKSSSMMEVDRALLLSASPEVATDLILGRLHPSSVLPRSPPPRAAPPPAPASPPPPPSEPQDAATSTSFSLSVSEGEDGAGSGEGLEGTEEILEGSEEGGGSLPSEVESASDSHVEEAPRGVSGRGRGGRGAAWEAAQRDSGRSSSHSDYLDDYLEQLTHRCSSGLLGLEASTAALHIAPPAPPVQDPAHLTPQEEQRSASAASERRVERRGGTGRTRRWSAGQPLDPSRSVGSKLPVDPDPVDYLAACSSSPLHPSSSSSTYSSSSSSSNHQEYLDSYLGHLTDDAWLQFPCRLSSRRLVYLSSQDYLASIRKAASSSSPSSSRKVTTSPSSSSTSNPSNGTGQGGDAGGHKRNGDLIVPHRSPISPRSPRDDPTEVTSTPDLPETPPDKTKVSSDEGIEVLESPVTPKSPVEGPRGTNAPQKSEGGGEVPRFVVGGPVGGAGEEGPESSSEDSSETEPSTIVYVDECIGGEGVCSEALRTQEEVPHTSPRKGPAPHASPRRDGASHTPPHSPHKDAVAPRDSPYQYPSPHSPYKDPSLLKEAPQLTASPRRHTTSPPPAGKDSHTMPPRSLGQQDPGPGQPPSSPQQGEGRGVRPGLRRGRQYSQEEEEEEEEEEECLVVQVYGSRSPSPPSEAGEKVVKIVPQRRGRSSSGGGRAVEQVLALLRERQQQEVEALRRRQQQEVQQCLQQLQGVSPEQLASLMDSPAPPTQQVTVVANATFSLEGGGPGGAAHPGLLPLLLGRDTAAAAAASDTNNNTTTAPNHNNNNNNYNYCTTTTSTTTTSTTSTTTTSTTTTKHSSPSTGLPPTMEYYRLCTPEEEDDKLEADLQPLPPLSHPAPTVTLQPGLFRVLGADGAAWGTPRPTTITSLLATHPEAFTEDAGVGGSGGEGGLDMVPQRESEAAAPKTSIHSLAKNQTFLHGLVRLQACARQKLTYRLLHTRLVQEQVATLAEIAKLARQFHRDIVADNLHRGDIQLHKALYKQEGLARERIWRVFHGLSVGEQMSLIRHDRKRCQAGDEQAPGTPTRHPHPPSGSSSSSRGPGGKRPTPSPPLKPQEGRVRIITPVKGRASHTQAPHAQIHTHHSPSHVHQPLHAHTQSPSYIHQPPYTHTQPHAHTQQHTRALRSPMSAHHSPSHAHHQTHTYTTHQPTYTHGHEASNTNAHTQHQTLYAHQPIHTPQPPHTHQQTHTHKQHAHTLSHQPLHSPPQPPDSNKLSPRISRLPLHLDHRAHKTTPQGPRSPQGVGRCASHPRTAPTPSGTGRGLRTPSRIPGQLLGVGRTLPSSSRTTSLASPRRAPPPRTPSNRAAAAGRRPWR